MARMLAAHFTVLAAPRARLSVGSRIEIRTAMMPMTTNSSTRVNADDGFRRISAPSKDPMRGGRMFLGRDQNGAAFESRCPMMNIALIRWSSSAQQKAGGLQSTGSAKGDFSVL